jgi:mannan endo-1,4-beta-mannosidase
MFSSLRRYIFISAIILTFLFVFYLTQNLRHNDGFLNVLAPLKNRVLGTATSKFLTKNGTQLVLFGQPYTFTGVNVYSAASLNSINVGCGGQVDDIDGLFSSLRPNSIVRFWGSQGTMGTNAITRQLDWTGIDRVVNTAASHGQRVIIALSDQSGTCDDGLWRDSSWYTNGFKEIYNPKGMTPLSYWEYVQQVVARYKDSPTIAMWELVNEPEASECMVGYNGSACYGHQSCPDAQAAANALRYFFDTVGGEVKRIDPNHLIESGVIGTGQCGADNWNYQYIHESPAIDVASYHDYNEVDSPMPGDPWNGLQVRLQQMKTIQKPLIIGEAGMLAQDNSSACMSFATRRDKLSQKMEAQFAAGIAGYLPWSWAGFNSGSCNFDMPPGDPSLTLIHDFPITEVVIPTPEVSPLLTPTVTQAPLITLIPTSVPLYTITPTPSPLLINGKPSGKPIKPTHQK